MKTANLDIQIGSELYVAGLTEDGTEYHAERYFIIAEDNEGNRWTHTTRFAGCRVEWDDEVGANLFIDTRPEAHNRAVTLWQRIAKAREIDLQHWSLARPVYGSVAYQRYGIDDDIAWERKFAA